MIDGRSDLSGKTALVTGAGARLGRATALALAAEGVSVIAHYRTSRAGAEETAAAARGAGVRAWVIEADLEDDAAAGGLFDRCVAAAGPIDFLINNASIFPAGRLADLTFDELTANVRINAMAPLVLTRAFAAQGRGGAVVNFLDTRIIEYDRSHLAYHLSKRMLYSLTRLAALEFAPAVRVNAVAPGLILPPPGKDVAFLEKLAGRIPLRRTGALREVTDAVLFLLRASYTTGQVIFVDGGQNVKGNVYG